MSRFPSGLGIRPIIFLSRPTLLLITVVNLAVFFVIWETVATYAGVSRIFLPAFSSVISEILEMAREGILVRNLWVSVRNLLIGLGVGLIIAFPLSYLVGSVKIIDRVVSPYIWALYAMPRIILVPLIFLWFGITNNARLAIVIVSVIPSFAVVVMEGVKTTDISLVRVARSFGASGWQVFTRVIIPLTVPFVGTGVRMAMLRGLIGLYIGELFFTADGLGSIIAASRARFDTARVFAVLLMFVLFAVAVLALTRSLENSLSRWRQTAVI